MCLRNGEKIFLRAVLPQTHDGKEGDDRSVIYVYQNDITAAHISIAFTVPNGASKYFKYLHPLILTTSYLILHLLYLR